MKAKKLALLITIILLLHGCRENVKTNLIAIGDNEFQQLSEEFLSGYLAWRPEFSVSWGFHEFDGKISDFSRKSIQNELSRLKKYDSILKEFDTASLSPSMFYDFRILRWGIQNEIFNFDQIQAYSKNPMTYAGMLDVSTYLLRNFAPFEERLKSIISIENSAPSLFLAARNNLADSLAKPFIETAIQVAGGSVEFLKNDLTLAVEKEVKNDSLLSAFKSSNDKAVSELRSFIGYLEKEKLPKAHNNYALGKEKYRKMLLFGERVSMDPGMILKMGLAELAREQQVFNATARIINPGKKAVEVYEDIQKEHPDAEHLISDAAANVEKIREFVVNKDIVTVPAEANIKVQETPQFARSTSTASMNAPGPFEKKATEAFFFITPVDPKWTARQKEDWLSMFDFYTTDIITIHEVYPGHYIHFLHLKDSKVPKVEKIFLSYALVEGWAHYSEKMMLDEGFGKSADSVNTAKYRLAQSGEALLRLCRLCVSIKTHCEGMSVDDATKFFMDNWYQGEKPSRQEALRGTWDPAYLYYSLGKLMILKLREDYKMQEKENFSLKHFHDLLLDNGAPPIPILRGQLLKNKNTGSEIL